MSDKELSSIAGASELGSLLQELGDEPPRSRTEFEEADRAERMAASIDREVATLHAQRRAVAQRWLWGAAAAVLLLALGAKLWSGRAGLPLAHISREPVLASPTHVKAPEPPAPVALPPAPSAKPPPHASNAPVASTSADPPPLPSADTPPEPANPASTLGEENRLFKEAAEASRQGDVPRALSRLDELLQKHPDSPLAQAAQVRKFRLLEQTGRNEDARREAARYLASYPTGFAVAEAHALQAPSPVSPSKPSFAESPPLPESGPPNDSNKAKERAP